MTLIHSTFACTFLQQSSFKSVVCASFLALAVVGLQGTGPKSSCCRMGSFVVAQGACTRNLHSRRSGWRFSCIAGPEIASLAASEGICEEAGADAVGPMMALAPFGPNASSEKGLGNLKPACSCPGVAPNVQLDYSMGPNVVSSWTSGFE